ncbi:MAG: multicopper oxidase domain-containing protein [Candidatus Scalindua sp.]|nr:multicopper oxidase domain-containing protein [Candidatus Scalindua sp.]
MVVNGVSWPKLEVAPAMYRFRLLNGCNSRFLNLALQHGPGGNVDSDSDDASSDDSDDGDSRGKKHRHKGKKHRHKGKKHRHKGKKHRHKDKKHVCKGKSIPFYQIGAEQGFLRQVVRIEPGFATPLPGDGRDVNPKHLTCKKCKAKKHWKKKCKSRKCGVAPVPATEPQQALLMGLAERADVIVDFRGLKDGDTIMMINTAPDAPFGGFPDDPADPGTSGQVMQFVVNSALSLPSDEEVTLPQNLVMNAEAPLGTPVLTRQVSLNEGESESLCVEVDMNGNVVAVTSDSHGSCFAGSFPMGPKEALLGTVDLTDPNNPIGVPLKWTAAGVGVMKIANASSGPVDVWVTENPGEGDIEDWEVYNFTADAHPIHQHLVRFEVINRKPIPGWEAVNPIVQPWENGMKDTVISYPGEITTIRSKFDVPGLYVWHCHIVEHEDNEMMRPYFVGP